MTKAFVVRFQALTSNSDEGPLKGITGTAWLAGPQQVVTCFHCVAYEGSRTWAWSDAPGGQYTLRAPSGEVVTCLEMGVALPEIDVAILHPIKHLSGIVQPMQLATAWIREKGEWHADANPNIVGKRGFRLTGLVTTVHADPGDKQIQLLVHQGTSVDWAGASGTPVIHEDGDNVVGMLTGQFDGAETCYAVGAHAIALALWADRCISVLPAEKRPAIALAIGLPISEDASNRAEDLLASALVAGLFTVEKWVRAIADATIDEGTLDVAVIEIGRRPEPAPITAEEDLRRLVGCQLSAIHAPTSNRLLGMYDASSQSADPVFVPPRLRKTRETLPKGEESKVGQAGGRMPDLERAPRALELTLKDDALGPMREGSGNSAPSTYTELVGLLSGADQKVPMRLAILGEAGSGKTTLLHALAEEILSSEVGLPIYLRYDELRGKSLFAFLNDEWLERRKVPSTARASYTGAISRLHCKRKLWILVDGIDEAGSDSRAPLDHIGRELADELRDAHVIVACRQSYWHAGLNGLYSFTIFELERFSVSQISEAVSLWLSNLSDRGNALLAALHEPPRAYLLDSVRNPLRLTMLCALWKANVLAGHPTERALPRTRSELYSQFAYLFHRWNAPYRTASGVDREELFAALGALAIAVLERGDDRQEIDEKTLRKAVGGKLPVSALRESGWLVQLPTVQPGLETHMFSHRTFLEFFAAKSIQSHDHLFATAGASPCYRALDPRWREVCLFWVGRADDVQRAAKDDFLDRLYLFRDKCSRLFEDRALFLAAECLLEHPSYPNAEEITIDVVSRAVGRPDAATGQWCQFIAPKREAARATTLHMPRDLVLRAAYALLDEMDDEPVSRSIAGALFEVFAIAAGADTDAGALAADMLLSGWAQADATQALPLFDNEGFMGRVAQALRRPGPNRERAIKMLGGPHVKGGRGAALLFDELRRSRSASVRRKLLWAIARLGGVSTDDFRFLERRAFAPATREREPYLRALQQLAPTHKGLAQRLFEAARDSKAVPQKQLYIDHLYLLHCPSDAAIESILDNLETWARACGLSKLMWVIGEGCRVNPSFVPQYVQALCSIRDPGLVWRSLSGMSNLSWCPASAERPLRALISASDNDGVCYWAMRLLLKVPGVDRDAIVKALDQLVRRFDDPVARQLETPWYAADTLRELGEAPPDLIAYLIRAIERNGTLTDRCAAVLHLGMVGKGSNLAAEAVLAFAQRNWRIDATKVCWQAGRALKHIGVREPAIVSEIVRLIESCEDLSDARPLLDCMTELRVGGDDAIRVAVAIVRRSSGESLTQESALAYLATREDRRDEVVSIAFELGSSGEPGERMRSLRCLALVGTDDARVLKHVAECLGSEIDHQVLHVAAQVFRELAGDIVHALPVVRSLATAWTNDIPVEANPNWRREEVMDLLQEIAARVPYEVFLKAWQSQGR